MTTTTTTTTTATTIVTHDTKFAKSQKTNTENKIGQDVTEQFSLDSF